MKKIIIILFIFALSLNVISTITEVNANNEIQFELKIDPIVEANYDYVNSGSLFFAYVNGIRYDLSLDDNLNSDNIGYTGDGIVLTIDIVINYLIKIKVTDVDPVDGTMTIEDNLDFPSNFKPDILGAFTINVRVFDLDTTPDENGDYELIYNNDFAMEVVDTTPPYFFTSNNEIVPEVLTEKDYFLLDFQSMSVSEQAIDAIWDGRQSWENPLRYIEVVGYFNVEGRVRSGNLIFSFINLITSITEEGNYTKIETLTDESGNSRSKTNIIQYLYSSNMQELYTPKFDVNDRLAGIYLPVGSELTFSQIEASLIINPDLLDAYFTSAGELRKLRDINHYLELIEIDPLDTNVEGDYGFTFRLMNTDTGQPLLDSFQQPLTINYVITVATTVDITFETNGGSPIQTLTSFSGARFNTPQNPTKTGYSFDGWYAASDFSGDAYQFTTIPDVDLTLHAKYTPANYTITYNLDSGTNNQGNPSSYTIETSTITLLDPTKTGYTFDGWYSDSGFTNRVTEITLGSTGDVSLYAKYTPANYTITYNLDSGTNNQGNPSSYTIETPTITLLDPTKTGYTFDGWYSDSGFTNRVTEITLGSTEDVSLYAKYTPANYTITYNLDSGTNNQGNPSSYTIETPTITLLDPTKTGYTFDGWYSDSGFTNRVTEITLGSTGDVSLYAKYTLNYTITYNLDSGTNNQGNPSSYTIETPTITLLDPTKTGYTFDGWYSDSGFTNRVTEIALGSTGNVSLYAKYTPANYTITYNLDSGTNNQGNPSSYTIETPTITLLDPTKTGYTFDGWYSDSGFTNRVTEIALGSTGNVSLYAKFNPNPETLVIDLINGFSTPPLEAEVLAARAAYDALTEAQQLLVTNDQALLDAEALLRDQQAADAVIALINGFSTPPLEAEVLAARAAYDALTEAQQLLVTNDQALLDAEALLRDQQAADAVIALINGFSTPPLEAEVLAARAAYDALTEAQQLLVTNDQALLDAEALLRDQQAADAVIALINGFSTPPLEAEVLAARAAYDALTEAQQLLVTNDQALLDAEALLRDQQAADAVIALINGFSTPPLEAEVLAARAAYDALTEAQQLLVTNDQALLDAEALLRDQQAADAVIALINGFSTPPLEAEVLAARAAYDALTEAQQLLVTNDQALLDAEALLRDQQAADAVIALINGFSTPPLEAEVLAARAAYDALTEAQQLLVTNDQALLDAEALLRDQQAADAVIALINGFSTPPLEAEVLAARAAYDALTEAQQLLVTNDQALLDAEALLTDQQAADAVIALINGFSTPPLEAEVLAARAAYDALTEAQQLLVTNDQALLDAEAASITAPEETSFIFEFVLVSSGGLLFLIGLFIFIGKKRKTKKEDKQNN